MADSKPRARGGLRPGTTCVDCGFQGHFKRNCPIAKAGNSDPASIVESVRENLSVNAVGPNSRRVYFEILVGGIRPIISLIQGAKCRSFLHGF